MKRTVLYARCSTQDQTLSNQIEQLKQYAAAQNWQIIEIVTDVSSGSKDAAERKGLDRVFGMAHKKQFDLLLFWALDRLSREGSRKTISYLTQLENYGVDWHSYSEPYISSLGIFADSLIALLSALARQEKIRIGERTKSGLERVRRAGQRLGRPRVSLDRISQAVALRKEGLSFSEVGKRMGISGPRAFQLVKDGQQRKEDQANK